MTVEYALLSFIALPVVVVTLGAVYFMWNNKGKEKDFSEAIAPTEDNEVSTEKDASVQENSAEVINTDEKVADVNKNKNT